MDSIQYIGEHLWIGQLGHLLVILSFVAALFSAWSYFKAIRTNDQSWNQLGKTGFIVHGLSLFGVIGLIIYAMFNHYYEYDYVYRTVSDSSLTHYLLAAFWADQEGSFLLWMFWHVILGWIIISKRSKWSSGTLITLSLIQAFLISMLLGIYLPFFEDTKIGSNPFIMIRDVYQAPIFANADYLTLIEGRGLNPLLQNYWMTIHPPVLFLGFASVSIPFCLAIASLSGENHKEYLAPLLKWSLFSAFIFGLGILMGGAWAYEALSFGGYWAWDPVENTSLVPWLILMAGIHTNAIAKSTGHSIKATYIYYLLAFLLVLYSTFLTRSGILGDTSVHAFTTMGLETQLVLFITFFAVLGIYKFWEGGKRVVENKKEEAIYSREFWMFVGALILFFSGLLMTVSTSLPVFNKVVELWNPNHVPIAIDDPMHHHNKYQIWIGVFIGLLSGLAIWLRYSGTNWKSYKNRFLKNIGICMLVTLTLVLLIGPMIRMNSWQHYTFLFAGLFAIITNISYILSFLKENLKASGAAFSHIGFGVLILGIMISGFNKRTITASLFEQQDFVDGSRAAKAVVLIKEQPRYSGGYWMLYQGDTMVHNLRKYNIEFTKVDSNNAILDRFITSPSAIYSNDFSKIEAINPGNERTLLYDVFTAAAPPPHMQDIESTLALEDSLKYLSYLISPGEIFQEDAYQVEVGQPIFNFPFEEESHADTIGYDLTIGLPLEVVNKRNGEVFNVVPGLGLKNALVFQIPVVIDQLGIKIKLPESSFRQIFTEEDELMYDEVALKNGDSVKWNEYDIELTGFDRGGVYKNYTPQEGDIAIAAELKISNESNEEYILKPLFILRNAQQFSIKDYQADLGLHVRFSNIDPTSERMTFKLATDERSEGEIELLIASDVPRSDILTVEANIFPGINLVWLGCLMMLAGIMVSLMNRRRIPA